MTNSIKRLAIAATGIFMVRDVAGKLVEDESGPWSITVHSPGTKEFQKAKHAYDEKRSDTLAAIMGRGESKRTPEDDAKDVAEFLAAVTISTNNFDYEGQRGHEAYKKMYADPSIGHVADELNKFLGNRANFLPPKPDDSLNSSGNSPG